PCYESLVFKLPANGASVPWHRDDLSTAEERVFNIDIYPDKSTIENSCVWCVPGSHLWPGEQAQEWIERGRADFRLPGAVPAEMEPGDVLLHHVKVLHGSTSNSSSQLRRVIYFDNRSVSWNRKYGWFQDSVMEKRCLLYQHALAQRRSYPYPSDDEQFDYTPPSGMPVLRGGEPVDLRAQRVSRS
ncbi:MAG TPA: phytanoyl-CoA dioxygenase family protein, partial [Chthonomonadales bacterium]|nr:phytanoyl-CoA dioxygenase family protein [Chthonomonadales bacterium]